MNETQIQDLLELLETFERKPYESCFTETDDPTLRKCEELFQLDYNLLELDNLNGSLSTRYPSRIFIPDVEHKNGVNSHTTPTLYNSIHSFVTFANTVYGHQNIIYEDANDGSKIRDLITFAKYARCRQRFVVPVMIYKGKYICRSATISVMPETYGRKVFDLAYDCFNGGENNHQASTTPTNLNTSNNSNSNNGPNSNSEQSDESLINNTSPFSYDEVIKSDIQLLNALNVGTIVDLMVEQRKVKYYVTVSSSEKADPENHYADFNLVSLPYPGCEFFAKFRDNNYIAKNLHYNWKQSFNDADLSLPKCGPAYDIDVNWFDYKKWDLVLMTQNYLKAILKYIQEENTGLLIHCISGWDRTPLFVSLVRLSLWADGLIHKSLNAVQMTYLTLAYDWYLFGHQLPDRLKRGEDIMFFCFHVLKYITEDEFSIVEYRKRTKTTSSSGSSSVIILKPTGENGGGGGGGDDDSIKDSDELDYIFNVDQDSNDSFSNVSNCDMSITENFYTSNITSRSPNPKRYVFYFPIYHTK
ncbi:MTMR14 family protein [Megaselia abdita]